MELKFLGATGDCTVSVLSLFWRNGEILGRIYLSVLPVLLDRMGSQTLGDHGAGICVLTLELEWFLQPIAYFPSQSPGPVQSRCFLSSKFLFRLSFPLPAGSQPALFTCVRPITLAHPCPVVLSQLFWFPLCLLLDISPSLSPTFFISLRSAPCSLLGSLSSLTSSLVPSFCIPACLTQFFSLLFLQFVVICLKLLKL